jgi:polar amino acid transport system substrate-binding protein
MMSKYSAIQISKISQLTAAFCASRFGTRILFLAALLSISPIADAGNIVQICVGDFPPYNSRSLPKYGPVIEITTEAFRRSGYQTRFNFMPWARILKEGEYGQCGILGIWRNTQRDLIFDYASPIIKQELGFFARRGSLNDLSNMRTLESLSIGMERGSYLPPILENRLLHFDLASSLHTTLLKLAKKRVDIAYGNKAAGLYMINADKNLQNIEWQSPGLEIKETYLAFAKTHKDKELLLQSFNRGLDSMKADGSYKKILKDAGL